LPYWLVHHCESCAAAGAARSAARHTTMIEEMKGRRVFATALIEPNTCSRVVVVVAMVAKLV